MNLLHLLLALIIGVIVFLLGLWVISLLCASVACSASVALLLKIAWAIIVILGVFGGASGRFTSY